MELMYYLTYGKSELPPVLIKRIEIVYIGIVPAIFLSTNETYNNCCSESAFFSPDHSLTIYFMIWMCIISYFYCSWRINTAPPLLELIINCLLLISIAVNLFIALHHNEKELSSTVHITILLLNILVLIKNQKLFIDESGLSEKNIKSNIERLAWRVLHLNIFKKFPLLILICFPLLVLLGLFLLLFGQKPDSAIRAFTDTYKHGLSELNDQCLNVVCPGPGTHFLCSIAANGNKNLVKPLRLGQRAGKKIVCNRQLLISNAFEELLQQRLPFIHKPVRGFYNKIGNLIHRYYGVFNYKWVSNMIYILMKPLEWFFLLVLYVVDKKPENRIASQYIDKNEM